MFWQHQILIAPYVKDLVLPDQLHGFPSKELFEHCTAFEIVSSDGLIMKKLKQHGQTCRDCMDFQKF
ncbi:hypothetical protein EAG_13558 [Camponotus floridanus]|uniref:Uncharacterized protein n=1 Tax=Camponotus floridanus TaxID=104421 RepID=E2APL9_CAMFO|nr:hypothetical protein EAG_13558 [Camponotus floridanus]